MSIPIRYLPFDFVILFLYMNCIIASLTNIKKLQQKTQTNDAITNDTDDVPNKDSENVSNKTTDMFKAIITSAIETIRGKYKRPDIYRLISKSEATNVDTRRRLLQQHMRRRWEVY